jgi:hypothetical protein
MYTQRRRYMPVCHLVNVMPFLKLFQPSMYTCVDAIPRSFAHINESHSSHQNVTPARHQSSSLRGTVGHSMPQLRWGTGKPMNQFHKRFSSMMEMAHNLNGISIQLCSTSR